jgi:hypothetical protein
VVLHGEVIASKQSTGVFERLFRGNSGFPEEDDVVVELKKRLGR